MSQLNQGYGMKHRMSKLEGTIYTFLRDHGSRYSDDLFDAVLSVVWCSYEDYIAAIKQLIKTNRIGVDYRNGDTLNFDDHYYFVAVRYGPRGQQ